MLAIVHAGPAVGARFTQYTAEFEAGGELGSTQAQRFIFVMEGNVTVELDGKRNKLGPRGYAYLPEGLQHHVSSTKTSRAVIIEKPYQTLPRSNRPA